MDIGLFYSKHTRRGVDELFDIFCDEKLIAPRKIKTKVYFFLEFLLFLIDTTGKLRENFVFFSFWTIPWKFQPRFCRSQQKNLRLAPPEKVRLATTSIKKKKMEYPNSEVVDTECIQTCMKFFTFLSD